MSKKTSKKPSTLITAFIRVSAVNQTSNGEVLYTKEDIEGILSQWSKDKKMKYALIEHEDHYHIVIRFSASTSFEQVKEKFPYGRIESARNCNHCIRYLTHIDHPEKTQYSRDDIITNNVDWVNKAFDEKRNVYQLIDENIDTDSYYTDGLNLVKKNVISMKEYTKYKSYIKNAIQFYYIENILPNMQTRNINVIMVYGKAGLGKTSFLKEYFSLQNCTFYVSPNRDPIQQYCGQDVLVLDDLRDDTFKFVELIKLLEQFTGSPVGSRNTNKVFVGHTIIISTNQPLESWYMYELSNTKSEDRMTLYRRIQQYWIFNENSVLIYNFKKPDGKPTSWWEDYYELVDVMENPISETWQRNNMPQKQKKLLPPDIIADFMQLQALAVKKAQNCYPSLAKQTSVIDSFKTKIQSHIDAMQKRLNECDDID